MRLLSKSQQPLLFYRKEAFMKKCVKRLISLLAAAVIPLSAAAVPAEAKWHERGYLGDLNNDGMVNTADLVLMTKFMLGRSPLTTENLYASNDKYMLVSGEENYFTPESGYLDTADMNRDGRVDVYDLIYMKKALVNREAPQVWEWDWEFISPPANDVLKFLPSQGEASMVVFYVDFPDCKHKYSPSDEEIEKAMFGEADDSNANYPFESVHAYYQRASKGQLDLKGKAFHYTAKNNKSYYESDGQDKSKLLRECYSALDKSVDFSQFDSDSDGYIDATLITVPNEAGDDYWWPCAGPSPYFSNPWVKFDGKRLGHLIVGNRELNISDDYKEFTRSYIHESGHCMGLPDYYLYNKDNVSGFDAEGLHGIAGMEMMDTDTDSDLSAVSKLQLGWYREDQVMVYDSSKGTQSFKLKDAQTDSGNCLLIPCGTLDGRLHSEYFLVEFATFHNNNSDMLNRWWINKTNSTGIRVYHVEASLYNNGFYTIYKYESGSQFTDNNNGKRFIRILRDDQATYSDSNFFMIGNVIDSSVSGFKWYADDGSLSVDTGLKIEIGTLIDGEYTVTVSAA